MRRGWTPVAGRHPDLRAHLEPCGDAHPNSFGFFASPERRLVFDLNDVDETARPLRMGHRRGHRTPRASLDGQGLLFWDPTGARP
jgi:hypothetical protein